MDNVYLEFKSEEKKLSYVKPKVVASYSKDEMKAEFKELKGQSITIDFGSPDSGD